MLLLKRLAYFNKHNPHSNELLITGDINLLHVDNYPNQRTRGSMRQNNTLDPAIVTKYNPASNVKVRKDIVRVHVCSHARLAPSCIRPQQGKVLEILTDMPSSDDENI